MRNIKIIAAVRNNDAFLSAVHSGVGIIFMLAPNIVDIPAQTAAAHAANKKLFIHLDLAEGIGKDAYGIRYAKSLGVDGIISTRSSIIKLAKKEEMFAIQRFFAVDTQSVFTSVETAKSSKADMIEIMPGTVTKVTKELAKELNVPIIAGGLIETEKEAEEAIRAGAIAVSTGKKEFWECKE